MALALGLNRQFVHGHDKKKNASKIQLNTEWNWNFTTLFTVAWSTRKLLHFFNKQKFGFASILLIEREKNWANVGRSQEHTHIEDEKKFVGIAWNWFSLPLRFLIIEINFSQLLHGIGWSQVKYLKTSKWNGREWMVLGLLGLKKKIKQNSEPLGAASRYELNALRAPIEYIKPIFFFVFFGSGKQVANG